MKTSAFFTTSMVVSIVLSAIIITTSSIGIKEYQDIPAEDRVDHTSGYTAQVVFLVLAILVVILMFTFLGLAHSKALRESVSTL